VWGEVKIQKYKNGVKAAKTSIKCRQAKTKGLGPREKLRRGEQRGKREAGSRLTKEKKGKGPKTDC